MISLQELVVFTKEAFFFLLLSPQSAGGFTSLKLGVLQLSGVNCASNLVGKEPPHLQLCLSSAIPSFGLISEMSNVCQVAECPSAFPQLMVFHFLFPKAVLSFPGFRLVEGRGPMVSLTVGVVRLGALHCGREEGWGDG